MKKIRLNKSFFFVSFGNVSVRRMMQFADKEIVVILSRQLSWSHFLTIIPIKNKEAKLFYVNQVSHQLMSVSDLRKQITLKAFERAAIANIQTVSSPYNLQYSFKDAYLLDFLNLGNTYLEKDLEQVIQDELEKFILK